MSPDPVAARVLADGSRPAGTAEFLERLAVLGIAARTVDHPPVFTVEEAARYKGDLPGAHTKNLFLRDKRGKKMWLVCALADGAIDLRISARSRIRGRRSRSPAASPRSCRARSRCPPV